MTREEMIKAYKRTQAAAAYIIGFSITSDYLAANPHLRFARGESDAGVIISCLIMVAMCYFANRLDWSIAVARALEWNIADAFMQCEDVCRYSEVIGSYYASLAQILLFTLLGALPQALSAIRSRKNETIVSVISAAKKGVEE